MKTAAMQFKLQQSDPSTPPQKYLHVATATPTTRSGGGTVTGWHTCRVHSLNTALYHISVIRMLPIKVTIRAKKKSTRYYPYDLKISIKLLSIMCPMHSTFYDDQASGYVMKG